MDEVSVSVDDEVFVGPVTLKEMKYYLTNRYYKPSANRRHTVAASSSLENITGESETAEINEVEAQEQSDFDTLEDTFTDLSCDESNVSEKVEKPDTCTFLSCSDYCRDSSSRSVSKNESDNDSIIVLSDNETDFKVQEPESNIEKNSTPNRLQKSKTGPKKYDYLLSKVGQYIKSKNVMPPPPPPQLKPTKQPMTRFKSPSYKNVVSPLGVYIKTGPSAPFVHKLTPRPMKNFSVASSLNTKQIATFDNLPKVVYKPAQMKVVSGTETVKLPPSVKKLCPQSIKSIVHSDRVVQREIDVSKELENTDLSTLSSTILTEDVSILNVKDVYIK